MKTDEENMLPQWILGCFNPAFQQLGYETDHSLPYTTQIRNVVPYTSYTLTHYVLYLYLIMCFSPFSCPLQLHSHKFFPSLTLCSQISRGSIRSTRGLGPTMTARGQSIGISIGMLPQALIMSRLDQLSQLGARI